MNNKDRGDKSAICFSFFSVRAEYLQKICIFNFPRYCSNVPKVRWVMSYRLVANFMRFPTVQNF